MRKILITLLLSFFVLSCGNLTSTPVVKNDDADYKKELAEQQRMLRVEKLKNGDFDEKKITPLYTNYFDYKNKLTDIMLPILQASYDFCKYTGYHSGVVVGKVKNISYKVSRFKNYPVVVGIVDRFARGTNNLRKGDVIVSVNGKSMIDIDNNMAKFTTSNFNSKLLNLKIYRKSVDKYYSVKIVSTPVCKMPFFLTRENMLNAYANDSGVYISIKMMDFLAKDEYIANVMAHEMSHNIMMHTKKTQDNIVHSTLAIEILGEIFGVDESIKDLAHVGSIFSGYQYSLSYESEADYIGAYIIARTNKYNISKIPYTWRRMLVLSQKEEDLSSAVTHPSGPARFVSLKRTIKEIELKKSRKVIIIPNFIKVSLQDVKDKQEEVNIFKVYKKSESKL